jgi:crotonobetainyl-CoA:carnitine CoA-transferase CaiB-like acyl-CoA transferase
MADTETITLECLERLEAHAARVRAAEGGNSIRSLSLATIETLLGCARKVLEQEAKPVPVGEVTREHLVEAICRLYPKADSEGIRVMLIKPREEIAALAQLLATRELAAYERGKAEREQAAEDKAYDWAIADAITLSHAQALADSAERERVEALLYAARGVISASENKYPDLTREEAERIAMATLRRVVDTFPHSCAAAERLVRP